MRNLRENKEYILLFFKIIGRKKRPYPVLRFDYCQILRMIRLHEILQGQLSKSKNIDGILNGRTIQFFFTMIE